MGKALDFLLPWDSQPQEAAGVDWENPLASKLLSQVGPGIYDPVTGGLYSLTGGPSISATSMGRALTFNGTTQCASWKYPYSGNLNNFSAAGWIKTTTTNNRAFCGRYETTTNNRSWFMGVANTSWVGAPSGNEFSVVVSTDGGVANIKAYYTTGISVADDSWHHVAFTFSGGTLLLYVDGVARTTTKNSDVAFTTIYGGTADLSLGAINPSTGGASFSNGSNLGFSVFERALSGAEIAALRSNTWQLSAPRSIWVPVSAAGGTDGSASTAPAGSTLTAPTATASASAQASCALAGASLTAPTATATGTTAGNATGTGAPAGLTLTAPTATASGSAQASGALAGATLTAPTCTASSAGHAIASGAPAGLTMTAPTATATGSAQAFAAFVATVLTAPTATASNGDVASVLGSLAGSARRIGPKRSNRQTATRSNRQTATR